MFQRLPIPLTQVKAGSDKLCILCLEKNKLSKKYTAI